MELFVSFSEIMHFYRKNRVRFALVVLAFGIVGGLLPLKFVRPVYTGSTVFTVTCGVPGGVDSDYHLQYTNILYSRVQSAVALASGDELLQRTAEAAGVDPAEVTKITAEQENSSPVVKLSLSTTNADKAAQLSDTAAELLCRELSEKFPDPVLTTSISDHAAPQHPQSKRSSMLKGGIIGLVIGLIAYVCFGILAVLSDKTIRNSRFAEEALKVRLLAEVPHESRDRNHALRTLRAAALNQAGAARSFLIANVCEHNGSDLLAAGFAASLALTGRTVLLVDGDLRSPKLAELLKLQPEKTLNDVLAGSCTLPQAAVPVPGTSGLSLLSGAAVPDLAPADLFAGEAFAKLVSEASGLYDYVVFHAPSEMHYPDAESLARSVSSVILAVKYGSTPFTELRESCSRISAAGGNVIGFVTTNA